MAELRQREPAKPKAQVAAKPDGIKNPKLEEEEEGPSELCRTIGSLFISFLICSMLSTVISYVGTGTYIYGFDQDVSRFAQKYYYKLNPRVFTLDELAKYDGSNPDLPIYLSFNHHVYDVTAGSKYYGKDGGYNVFAGRDATRAFATGDFVNDLNGDISDFDEEKMKQVLDWQSFYDTHAEYFFVGTVSDGNSKKAVKAVKAASQEKIHSESTQTESSS
eukprot:Colp12_sorted_trinity150504_noHs@14818